MDFFLATLAPPFGCTFSLALLSSSSLPPPESTSLESLFASIERSRWQLRLNFKKSWWFLSILCLVCWRFLLCALSVVSLSSDVVVVRCRWFDMRSWVVVVLELRERRRGTGEVDVDTGMRLGWWVELVGLLHATDNGFLRCEDGEVGCDADILSFSRVALMVVWSGGGWIFKITTHGKHFNRQNKT